jgi:hypothetical protein
MAHSMVGFSTPFWVDFRFRFTPVLTVIFTAPFSVGDRPGNCLFHWVFWELAPFFECFVHLALNLPFV